MKKGDVPSVKLNKAEFAMALQKGLGRAFLHATCCGLDDVLDIFIEACVHNQKWDDSSPLRSKWLFSMFKDTPHYDKISLAILNTIGIQTNTDDLQQLVSLCQEMALKGDERALPAIEKLALEKASRLANDDWLGAEEYINLTGVKGGIALARFYGRRLLNNPEEEVFDTAFTSNSIKEELEQALFLGAQIEPELDAYWKYLQSRKKPKESNESRLVYREIHIVEDILRDAKNNKGEYPGRYYSFGRRAAPEILEEVYSNLIMETDDGARTRLLWVFRAAKLPRLNELFFQWARGINDELRAASIVALSHISDNQIHELARTKIEKLELEGADSGNLRLFINNFKTNDALLITKALNTIRPNQEDAHDLAWSISDIAIVQKDKELVKALTWAYENTPCSNCRAGRIVPRLDELGGLKGDILYECQFDAEEEIQTLARKRLSAV